MATGSLDTSSGGVTDNREVKRKDGGGSSGEEKLDGGVVGGGVIRAGVVGAGGLGVGTADVKMRRFTLPNLFLTVEGQDRKLEEICPGIYEYSDVYPQSIHTLHFNSTVELFQWYESITDLDNKK
ncbi:hypothetical protein SK128_016427 [Halocaridina rubra]|uniref:Uncharacterized protein n=1 Tax=Halocaridina rubra TaxID=373956 RepID=A0AAN9A9N8_HALRR